jgi:hypothetical protein
MHRQVDHDLLPLTYSLGVRHADDQVRLAKAGVNPAEFGLQPGSGEHTQDRATFDQDRVAEDIKYRVVQVTDQLAKAQG